MDGVLLVLDSRNPAKVQALAQLCLRRPKPVKAARAVPAFATLILALVLGMVYYVSTPEEPNKIAYTPHQPKPATTVKAATPVVNPHQRAQHEAVQPEELKALDPATKRSKYLAHKKTNENQLQPLK